MKKANTYYYVSLACTIWFICHKFDLDIYDERYNSFPFGVTSFLLMHTGKEIEGRTNRFKTIENILLIGCCISFIVLVGLMLYN